MQTRLSLGTEPLPAMAAVLAHLWHSAVSSSQSVPISLADHCKETWAELKCSQGKIEFSHLPLQTGNTCPPLSAPGISSTGEQYFWGFILGVLWHLWPHPVVFEPSLLIQDMRIPCSHTCPTFLSQTKVCRKNFFFEEVGELEEQQRTFGVQFSVEFLGLWVMLINSFMWLNSSSWTMNVIMILVIFSERCKIILCDFEEYSNNWMKGHHKWVCYCLNLLVQDAQCNQSCPLCPAQCISYFFTHTMKSGTRSYMFGNKKVSQEFGCQSRMGFHCVMERKKGMKS